MMVVTLSAYVVMSLSALLVFTHKCPIPNDFHQRGQGDFSGVY